MSFTYNGEIADQTEVWEPGGAPADLVNGIELSVTGPPAPTAPDTGNARRVPSTSSTATVQGMS